MTEKEKVIKIYNLENAQFGNKRIPLKSKDQRNPGSLRFVIAHVLDLLYGSRKSAADHLSRVKSPHVGDNELTYNVIGDIVNDESYIKYWHLDCIARSMRIPSGALLIYSKLYSHIQKGEPAKSAELVASMHKFSVWLEAMSSKGTLSKSDLDNLIQCFETSSNIDHPSLKN